MRELQQTESPRGGLLAASRDTYRTLSLTRAGREVMAGRQTDVALTVPEPPPPKMRRTRASKALAESSATADPRRVEVLREWRKKEAARRAVPAYVVFHDRTLVALAAARPATLDDLSAIPGIGPAKLEAYGEDLLALFAAEGS